MVDNTLTLNFDSSEECCADDVDNSMNAFGEEANLAENLIMHLER